jgi:hypothetical protein
MPSGKFLSHQTMMIVMQLMTNADQRAPRTLMAHGEGEP